MVFFSLTVGPGYKPSDATDFTYTETKDSGLPYDIASCESLHFAIAKGPMTGKNIAWDLHGRNLLVIRDFTVDEHLSIINANIIVSFGNFSSLRTTLSARQIIFLNSGLTTAYLKTPTSITKVSLDPEHRDYFTASCVGMKNLTLFQMAQLYGLIAKRALDDKVDMTNAKSFFACPFITIEPRGGAGSVERPFEASDYLCWAKGKTIFYKESTSPGSDDQFLTLEKAVDYIYTNKYEKPEGALFELCSFGPVAIAVVRQSFAYSQKLEWDAGGSTLLFLSPIKVESLVITNAKAIIFMNTVQAETLSLKAERTILFAGMAFSKRGDVDTLLIEQPLEPRLAASVVKSLESAVTRSSPIALLRALASLLRLYSNLSLWPSTELFHALAFLHDPPFALNETRRGAEEGGGGGAAAAAAAAATLPSSLLADTRTVHVGEGAEDILDAIAKEATFSLVGEVRFYNSFHKLSQEGILDIQGADLVILSDLHADKPIRIINARRVISFGTILTPLLEIKATGVYIINKLAIAKEIKSPIVEVLIPSEAADYITVICSKACETKKEDEALEAVEQAFDTISYYSGGLGAMTDLLAHLKARRAIRTSAKASGGLSSWLLPVAGAIGSAWTRFTEGLESAGMKDVLKAAQGKTSVTDAWNEVVARAVDEEDYLEVQSTAKDTKRPASPS